MGGQRGSGFRASGFFPLHPLPLPLPQGLRDPFPYTPSPSPSPRDYVKKIAVYKDKLAVQLPNKVVIYELANGGDDYDMHYQSATKIMQKLECNLLVVTSSHVILCQVGERGQGCGLPSAR